MIKPSPQTLSLPYCEAEQLFSKIADEPFAIFLDSCPDTTTHDNRYSIIGLAPFQTMEVKNGYCAQTGMAVSVFDTLQTWIDHYAISMDKSGPPIQGGILGLWGYECGRYLEKLPKPNTHRPNVLDCCVGCYDCVIVFDHTLKTTTAYASGHPETDRSKQQALINAQFDKVQTLFDSPLVEQATYHPIARDTIESNFDQTTYEAAVEQSKAAILRGDIFEINISQCFETNTPDHFQSYALYQQLRQNNAAPFAGYFHLPQMSILSCSPERFLSLADKTITCMPIKGTIHRSPDPTLDAALGEQLINSEKDRAENIMIVDLMRNDISRVCYPHTVQVPSLCALRSYAKVHHLVSKVTGRLIADKSAVDLLTATFPGGSITGAPKIRAMELITEIEQRPRGPYCGSLGYIGFDGTMDLSICIRTLTYANDHLYWQAGGAITLDSDPHEEYEETLTKARVITDTVCGAH